MDDEDEVERLTAEVSVLEDKVYDLEERNGQLAELLNRCVNYMHGAKGPPELIAEAEDLLCAHTEEEE